MRHCRGGDSGLSAERRTSLAVVLHSCWTKRNCSSDGFLRTCSSECLSLVSVFKRQGSSQDSPTPGKKMGDPAMPVMCVGCRLPACGFARPGIRVLLCHPLSPSGSVFIHCFSVGKSSKEIWVILYLNNLSTVHLTNI